MNPDDLDGEELDAWYRRSPADIEQARQSAAQQAYQQFFYGGTDDLGPDNSDQPPSGFGSPARSGSLRRVGYASAALANSTGASCPMCHGQVAIPPGPIQPVPRPEAPSLPSPWDAVFPGWPVLRDMLGNGGGSSKPPEPDRKQCEIQLQRDGQICARQPTARANAVCRGTAMDRYAHCRDTGEVDTPRLYTVPGYGR